MLYVWRKCHVWAVFVDLPFVCRLRCLRGSVGWPGGRRLVAPTPPRSVGAGLLDLAKYKGAEVWLRRFLLRPSLSIGLDLAFLITVPGVGTRLPKSREGRFLTCIEDKCTPQEITKGHIFCLLTWWGLVVIQYQICNWLVVYGCSWTASCSVCKRMREKGQIWVSLLISVVFKTTKLSQVVSHSTHLVKGWWTVEYMDSYVRIPMQLWTCTNQMAEQEVKSMLSVK